MLKFTIHMNTPYTKRAHYITSLWKDKFSKFFADDLIATPFALIDEILDKLSIDWSNPALTFCDPCFGSGRFLMAIKYRLLDAGHSEQWIIENMIYGCDIDPKNVAGTVAMLGASEYNRGITCGDSLDREWGMKFDVVVGNPPYSTPKQVDSTRTGQLYVSFVHLALKLSDRIAYIIPSLWTDKKSAVKQLISSGLVECFETTHHFNINVPTCGIVYDTYHTGVCSIVNSSGEQFSKDISDGLIPLHGNLTTTAIIAKLTHKDNLSSLWKRSNVNRNDTRIGSGSIPMIETAGAAQAPLVHTPTSVDPKEFVWFTDWKVIANNVGEWKSLGRNIKIVPPNVGTSYSVIALGAPTSSEASVLLSYLQTKLVKFIVRTVKNNTPNSKTVFASIPFVDLSREWSDDNLYDHFNLTLEERQLIEDTIK